MFSNYKQKSKRISIIDDPKLFLRSSVQLTRLSLGKWVVQSNIPEKEPEATAASAPENVHQNKTVQSNQVSGKEPEEASSAANQTKEQNYAMSAQTSKPSMTSSEPKAGTSQNVTESVFIKTELPDYLEDVTFIDDEDDIVDLSESDDDDDDDDDVVFICD